MKAFILIIALFGYIKTSYADEINNLRKVLPETPLHWNSFPLSYVRILPDNPFHHAMQSNMRYLSGMDVDLMLNELRKNSGMPVSGPYPGSDQPIGTRPGSLPHYMSAVSIMYAQTGIEDYLDRINYIINVLCQYEEIVDQTDSLESRRYNSRIARIFNPLLEGTLILEGPDAAGFPWRGIGNVFYVIHKSLAGLRDAYIYADNTDALKLFIKHADIISDYVLKTNPDLFEGLLTIEHGGMIEVFMDLYVLTGNNIYKQVSERFNQQKVILNIAHNKDVLYTRHANMQIPIFVGTAKQHRWTGDRVAAMATKNFFKMVYSNHTTCIGGNSCYERFGKPGEISKRLGFTSCETCNTYNMLKIALLLFEITGDVKYMDYYERALYNHILASQDPESGGMTYYTSLKPGGFKSFSDGYNLKGVWCCVGTGMESHSKYGTAVYFHNNKDLFVNLFIPSKLTWHELGMEVEMETEFPDKNKITLTLHNIGSFKDQIVFRHPSWQKKPIRFQLNGMHIEASETINGLVALKHEWKDGDVIDITFHQSFHLEEAQDDPNLVCILKGPIVYAGMLGKELMPENYLVPYAEYHRNLITPKNDIPILVASRVNVDNWLIPENSSHVYTTKNVAFIEDKINDISLMPFYRINNQRYTVYWKLFTPDEYKLRKLVVSDEINPASSQSEDQHNLQGLRKELSAFKDERFHVKENNRPGRVAHDGGWFSYDMKVNHIHSEYFLMVTYWGNTPENHEFDIFVENYHLVTENITDRFPFTYFDVYYKIPKTLLIGKDSITIKFSAHENKTAGPVFGLKLTSDPEKFKGYIHY